MRWRGALTLPLLVSVVMPLLGSIRISYSGGLLTHLLLTSLRPPVPPHPPPPLPLSIAYS